MLSCRRKMLSLLTLLVVMTALNHKSMALPIAAAESDPSEPKLVVITEDVIPDAVEMDHKKVIRVNPLDLPPIKEDPNKASADSSLYNIQSIQPYKPKRKYVNSQNMRKPLQPQETTTAAAVHEDSPIVQALPVEHKFVKPKHQPKKKHLHFLYNQEDLSHHLITKTMPVHTAPGAYPVFYGISRANGSFGKYPMKSFSTPEAFMKYLHKNKFEHVKVLQQS